MLRLVENLCAIQPTGWTRSTSLMHWRLDIPGMNGTTGLQNNIKKAMSSYALAEVDFVGDCGPRLLKRSWRRSVSVQVLDWLYHGRRYEGNYELIKRLDEHCRGHLSLNFLHWYGRVQMWNRIIQKTFARWLWWHFIWMLQWDHDILDLIAFMTTFQNNLTFHSTLGY